MNYFEFLLQNILCATDCMMLIMRLLFFLGGGGWIFSLRLCVFMSPQIKGSALNLYRHFKTPSELFTN